MGLVIIGSLIAPALWFHVFKTANIALKTFFPKAVLLLFGASLGQWLGGMFAFLMIGRLMQVPVSMVSVYPNVCYRYVNRDVDHGSWVVWERLMS